MAGDTDRVTIPALQQMKGEGRKIVGVVVYDHPTARIVDRAGVDLVSVGDTVGVNVWGRDNPLDVTLDEMVLVARAVRRGVRRALLSCDFPYGPLQEGPASAVSAAVRLARDAGVDLVKLDGAADFPEAVEAVVRAGVPVFAQFGLTPQTALRTGLSYATTPSSATQLPPELAEEFVAQARTLEAAGASLLNLTNSGPVVGAAVSSSVGIPVVGGHGGGPWLDGRMRLAPAAFGWSEAALDEPPDTYAHLARTAFDAVTAYAGDVRAGRQVRGGIPVPDAPADRPS